MTLYTGRGDTGTTKLYGCTVRIAKDEPRVEALGNLDELNSWLGLCFASTFPHETFVRHMLRTMQEDLFIIQALVAGAPKEFSGEKLARLESLVARVEAEIPPIHSFTIAGATVLSAMLDVARTIARRTERSIVSLRDDAVQPVIPYLNRLSSALFALARLVAHRACVKEGAPAY